MSADHTQIREHLAKIFALRTPDEVERCMLPSEADLSPRVAGATKVTPAAIARRWGLLELSDATRAALHDASAHADDYARNIENYIGTVKLPLGLAGPLRMRGVNAQGDFYIPLATTEAAMVASYTRGAQIVSLSGGCAAAVISEGVSRSPGFAFRNLAEAGRFVHWATGEFDRFKTAAESTTRHGKLVDMRVALEGNHVFLIFNFTTGDAGGQNMVTIATDAICRYITESTPVKPRFWFVEANMSGDKKASMQSFLTVRGRKVVAEVVVPSQVVERRLHTSVGKMVDYYRMSSLGGVMSGMIGVQGHFANGLAALYIACGQDAACVAESAVGITRFEATPEGHLYASATLPNLIVGTVGGGTGLPTQRACLEILRCAGSGRANAFAEICAGVALAGEISIVAALAADQFTHAHQRLARGRQHEPHGPSAPDA